MQTNNYFVRPDALAEEFNQKQTTVNVQEKVLAIKTETNSDIYFG